MAWITLCLACVTLALNERELPAAYRKFSPIEDHRCSIKLLARWASRHPADAHFIKEIHLFSMCCFIKCSFEQDPVTHFGCPLFKLWPVSHSRNSTTLYLYIIYRSRIVNNLLYAALSIMQRWMYLSGWAPLWVQQTLVFFEAWSVLEEEAGVLPFQQVLFCLNTDIPEEEG